MNPQERENPLSAHARECEECREQLPVAQLCAELDASEVPIAPLVLSRRVLERLSPEIEARSARLLRRRVLRALAVCLIPLLAVIGYDLVAFGFFYAALDAVLPHAVAVWLISGYAVFWLLLLVATYAAIPVLVARQEERLALRTT